MTSTRVQFGIALFLLVVIAGLYGLAYYTVARESSKALSLATDIQAKSLAVAHVAQAKRALASLSEDETEVNQYFVDENNIVSFLESVQQTGKNLGATVTVVSVTSEDELGHSHIALSLQITGSFDSVLRTIGALEYGPHDASIQNLTIENTATDAGAWTASGVFLIGTRSAAPAPTT